MYKCTNTLNTVERRKGVIKLDYKDGKPLHEQITHGIKELIMCGALKVNEQLPSVRDLSVSLTVNPNTVQRAYKTLETEGLIYSVRGRGSFVSDIVHTDRESINKLYAALSEAAKELVFYGEDEKRIEAVLQKAIREMEGSK